MTQFPKHPWEILNIDFYGPLPLAKYLLVLVDRYSRFPEVQIVGSTKVSVVIPKLDKIFAVHGIPTIIRSDNGPPFNGEDYRHYLNVLGIKTKFATPKWPQGNAPVERLMQPLGKALKIAKIEGRPWRQELQRLMQRRCDIEVRDMVLIRQEKQTKLTANFSSKPYTVLCKNNTEITAISKGGHTMRIIPKPGKLDDGNVSDGSEDDYAPHVSHSGNDDNSHNDDGHASKSWGDGHGE